VGAKVRGGRFMQERSDSLQKINASSASDNGCIQYIVHLSTPGNAVINAVVLDIVHGLP
jgi:hypothetical protein